MEEYSQERGGEFPTAVEGGWGGLGRPVPHGRQAQGVEDEQEGSGRRRGEPWEGWRDTAAEGGPRDTGGGSVSEELFQGGSSKKR